MKLVNILNVLICILCGYIHVHVHVYCDEVYSTYIGTCSYVIVSYLIMSDNILTAAIMTQGDHMELILIN